MRRFEFITLALLSIVALSGAATAGDVGTADLLSMRTEALPSAGQTLNQDIGGTEGAGFEGFRGDVARPMLLSLLMPGLGEVSMGYKRGYAMMALDIASWFAAKSAHDRGGEIRDEYYAYADSNWALARLAGAFGAGKPGTFYYGVTQYTDLSLWVSEEDDRREYYENLGKWDQFVFGWNDFQDPRNWVDASASDLRDVRVSANRETYRGMRIDSNDRFRRRDLLIKINMGTRLLSMLQVAWLKGVFGGDEGPELMTVGDHRISLINETRGLTSGRIGLTLSY